ncbi:MAG: AI-2E family transporter [Gammaproteobacteria bacterium]|nr:AI-2E family transporter [Gammaproteobacteria bacterium]
MQLDSAIVKQFLSSELVDALVRFGLIAFVVVMCVKVFSPFMGLMLWGLILAVALYPFHQRLAKFLGGRQGRASTLMVVIGLVMIGLPTVIVGSSFAGQIHDVFGAFQEQTISVRPPDPAVAQWPLIGKKVYGTWSAAADNFPKFLENMQPQLEKILRSGLAVAANTAGGLFLFLGSLIIAGIMMAYGESGSLAMRRILCRLSSPGKGRELQSLSTATVRSVAVGVLGVAFIQALLLGIGFVLADIPGAGLLAIVVMVLGIAQLPATLVSLPVIAYIWWSGDGSTMSNIFYSVYLIAAGLVDNVLKPLLLGRGVDAPMPIILLGALGGMVSAGIIGLFVGAVLLAVGYQIFMDWVDEGDPEEPAEQQHAAGATPVTADSE